MTTQIKHLKGDGHTEYLVQELGFVLSGSDVVRTTPQKWAIENIGDRALGAAPFTGEYITVQQVAGNDGASFYRVAADPNGTLSRPWGPSGPAPSVVTEPSGGSFSAGTYGVRVTAVNAVGETTGSAEVAFSVGASGVATYTWARVPGASSYRVYRRGPGATGYGLRATVTDPGSGETAEYEDDGSATTSGTPPTVNTTGSTAYSPLGDPPDDEDFNSGPLLAAAPLNRGQQAFYWVRLVVPPGTSALGNDRIARVLPQELTL